MSGEPSRKPARAETVTRNEISGFTSSQRSRTLRTTVACDASATAVAADVSAVEDERSVLI